MWRKAVILFFVLPAILARSQPGQSAAFPQLRFSQLTEKDGLSCDWATAVTQDEDGLIWIATSNGLNRFDGYGCMRFFANPDNPAALPANEMLQICTGRRHDLWLNTAGGICRFDIITHQVDKFQTGASTPSIFRDFAASGIWFDRQGTAFISAPEGLYQITDNRHYRLMEEGLQPFVRHERTYKSYREIVSDRAGGLWAFQENMIFQLDPVTKKAIRSFSLPLSIGIYALLFDHANRCWVSTWHSGILRFDPYRENGSTIPIVQPPGNSSLSPGSDFIGGGLEWTVNSRAYLAYSSGSGLLLVDEETGKTQLFLHQTGLHLIGRPFADRQNILWIPTDKGVFYLNAAGNLWDLMPLGINRDGRPDFSDQTIPYVMREEDNGYWIGRRYHGGMLWYDRDWKLIRGWKNVVDSVGIPVRKDVATTKEAFDFHRLGEKMFITTEFGIVILDLKTYRRTLIGYPGASPLMRLRTIIPVDPHHWWVRSFDHGIFVFDPTLRRFTRHYPLSDTCATCDVPHANYMIRSRTGDIFVSSTTGLLRYDAGSDRLINIHPVGHPTIGNSLFGMAEDSAGLIWIGNDNGICAYNPVTGKIVRSLSENNSIGLVYRVTVDSAQNVWFTSPAGYWCWLRRQDKTILFGLGPGLPDNNEGLFFTAANGNVYAGCLGALVCFHPNKLRDYNVDAAAKIMDILVGGNAVVPDPYPKGVREIRVAPGQNDLQIDFDVINYDIPANNLFFYRLIPGTGSWTAVDNGRLSFQHLSPGEYELSVRGGNKLTGSYTATDRLLISILPYWWQSTAARAAAALILLALIIFIVRLRIRAIRRESAFREKIAETEMQALRAQMNPHFIFNSLTSIENFIMQNERRLASDYLSKFARLIRMILNSSRNELVPLSKDLEALRLYVDLEQLRFDNKFSYRTEIDPILIDEDCRVPPMLIQPYVENAIVHGIGYSDRDDLVVCVRVFAAGDHIHFVIRDNGIGRGPAEEINRVNRQHHKSIGLGITEDRIHIFSRQQQSAGSVRITDLFDGEGLPAGTQVDVIIKAVETSWTS